MRWFSLWDWGQVVAFRIALRMTFDRSESLSRARASSRATRSVGTHTATSVDAFWVRFVLRWVMRLFMLLGALYGV